ELLLRAKLKAEVRNLAFAALAMLARAIFAAIDGALWATEDILAHAAIEFILGAAALRHFPAPIRVSKRPEPHRQADCTAATTASPDMQGQLQAARLAVEAEKVKATNPALE